MASATKQTKIRRRIRKKQAGKASRKLRGKQGTPEFPIHLEDSKKSPKAS